jgi:transposase-like protein
MKKVVKDKKSGKKKTVEIKRNYRAVPLEKLALVCEVCGREKPILKLKTYTPRFCEHCGVTLQLRLTGSLSHICWSDDLTCLKVADKFEVKRIK